MKQRGGNLNQLVLSSVNELATLLAPTGKQGLANVIVLLTLHYLAKGKDKKQKGGNYTNMLMPMGHDALLAVASLLLLNHFLGVRPSGKMLGGGMYKQLGISHKILEALGGMAQKRGYVVSQKGSGSLEDQHLNNLQNSVAPLSQGNFQIGDIMQTLGKLFGTVDLANAGQANAVQANTMQANSIPNQEAGARKKVQKKQASLLKQLERMVKSYTKEVQKVLKKAGKSVTSTKRKSSGKRKSKKSKSKRKTKSKSKKTKSKKTKSKKTKSKSKKTKSKRKTKSKGGAKRKTKSKSKKTKSKRKTKSKSKKTKSKRKTKSKSKKTKSKRKTKSKSKKTKSKRK